MNKDIKQKITMLKLALKLPTCGTINVEQSKNGNYYVTWWKEDYYKVDDVIQECREIIQVLTEFNEYIN